MLIEDNNLQKDSTWQCIDCSYGNCADNPMALIVDGVVKFVRSGTLELTSAILVEIGKEHSQIQYRKLVLT